MNIGYARVSTDDQKLDHQIDALKDSKCDKIFSEKITGAKANRPELDKALSYLRQGDTLVVFKLDRLGRTLKQLVELIHSFKEKGIHFKSIKDGIDTSTPTGTFFFHVIGAFSELERELIQERTRAGLKAARSRGKLGGRPKVHTDSKKETAFKLYMENKLSVKQISEDLGMSHMTIYRYIRQRKETSNVTT